MNALKPAGRTQNHSVTHDNAAQSTRPVTVGAARVSYLPALDGLRALAVLAVLLYHAAVSWLPGGFLGVEVFFVISGYLITSLLLAEWAATGKINLAGFWLRRARRLLPAAFLLVVASLSVAAVVVPEELAGLREDALAAFTYVTNWYLIADNQSYFDAVGRPSLLRHLWSLAVEEQFYLVWPLVFALVISRFGRRALLTGTLVAAGASAVLMAVLFQPDLDPSRIYYGTDTRASGLLLGAALAFVWIPGRAQGRFDRLPFDLIGFAALGMLALFGLRLDEFQPLLYRGGFVLVGLVTAALIAAGVHPRAVVTQRVLGIAPLRWVGVRSYGLYLWHWPVFALTRPLLDVPFDGVLWLLFRLGVTFVFAALSYRYFEAPIRNGALGRSWLGLRGAQGRRRLPLAARWIAVSAAIAVATIHLGGSVANAQPPAPPAYLSISALNTIDPSPESVVLAPEQEPGTPLASATATPTAQATATPVRTPEPEATATAGQKPAPATPTPVATKPAPTQAPPVANVKPGRVTAIGDSVMLGAAGELNDALGNVAMDAAIGRQVGAAVEVLRAREAAGQLGKVVVLHLGNNGTFSRGQFDEVMKILGAERQVAFVNLKVPRPWEGPNNAVIADGASRYANAVLVDWHGASAGAPELFWDDGIHVRPAGATVYAALVAEALAAGK